MKLIFIHGSGNTGEIWCYQAKHFLDAEAINLPGHPQGELCDRVEDYANWLHRYILEQRYSEPVLIGHSLGGAIAQLYALNYPQDIKALILISTGAKLRVAPQYFSLIHNGIETPSVWLQNFVESLISQVPTQLKQKLIKEIAEVGASVQLNDMLCCDKFDIMDKVHQIKIPTLILCGSEDRMTPPRYSFYLANKIKGAKLTIIAGGTHFVFAEKYEEVNQAIQDFLDNELR